MTPLNRQTRQAFGKDPEDGFMVTVFKKGSGKLMPEPSCSRWSQNGARGSDSAAVPQRWFTRKVANVTAVAIFVAG
jgi:hypothetical protein